MYFDPLHPPNIYGPTVISGVTEPCKDQHSNYVKPSAGNGVTGGCFLFVCFLLLVKIISLLIWLKTEKPCLFEYYP
jgi:hypothetical protein